jgi:hypothetical protein
MKETPEERRKAEEENRQNMTNILKEHLGKNTGRLNQRFVVGREKQNPFPEVSPDRLAEIAASLYPDIRDPEKACRHAAKLIRFAQVTLESERAEDERTNRYLESNEPNDRWRRILGEEIEAIQKGKKRKTMREKEGHGDDDTLAPFPVSRAEIVSLFVERGKSKSNVRAHLNTAVAKYFRETHPDETEEEIKRLRKKFLDGPIDGHGFSQLIERWDALREIIEEFSGKK